MSCGTVASTGVPALTVLALGAGLLAAGTGLLLLTRRRRAGITTAVVMLGVLAGGLVAGSSASAPASAGTPGCTAGSGPASAGPASAGPDSAGPTAGPSSAPVGAADLTIIQTSTMAGLAPGVAPAVISGTITNRGSASTYVAAVTVTITGVTAATVGTCDTSDYLLLDKAMPVGRTLRPGESANFTGARIGFYDKAVNQDACQRAVIHLRYVSS